jgi:hypothetical protein
MTQPTAAVLVFLGTAITTAAVVMAAWKEYALVVMAVVALYFFGGIVFMPWRTPLRHAFSAGVFLGIASAILLLIYRYNSR